MSWLAAVGSGASHSAMEGQVVEFRRVASVQALKRELVDLNSCLRDRNLDCETSQNESLEKNVQLELAHQSPDTSALQLQARCVGTEIFTSSLCSFFVSLFQFSMRLMLFSTFFGFPSSPRSVESPDSGPVVEVASKSFLRFFTSTNCCKSTFLGSYACRWTRVLANACNGPMEHTQNIQ